MTTANDARKAHKILDDLSKGKPVLDEEREFLRSTLPELPEQKTLEGIAIHVLDAWSCTSDNRWGGDGFDPDVSLEDWLWELHAQLQGLKDAPANTPALPAGMRLADHEEYGRVVVSPGLNDFGLYLIFVLDSDYKEGAHWHCEHGRTLTFIDAEPAKPTHPEFLETEADYQKAPDGTIVAWEDSLPWHKFDSEWLSTAAYEGNSAKSMTGVIRRVLRWGDGL